MTDAVRFVVHGVDELEAAFMAVAGDVVREARHGFMPEHRYLGQGGIPFTGETVELVATSKGFMVTDGR